MAVDGLYVLENLQPTTTYDFRFGCKNRVGFSKYEHNRQITTTKKREPEAPFLSIQTRTKTLIGDPGNVIELPTDQEYEVSWKIPRDNGEYIDFFLLSYYAVKALPEATRWERIDDITKVEIPNRGNVRWGLNLPYKDTFYQVNLAAHNRLGYSQEAQIIVKTPSGGNEIPAPGATKGYSSQANTLSGTNLLLLSTALLFYTTR